MYSRKNTFKINEIPLQFFFKLGSVEINQTQQYSNFPHTFWYEDYAIDLSAKLYFTSKTRLSNGIVIDWYY